MLGLMDLPDHDGKVMSDKKIFLSLLKGVRVEIEIFTAFFSVIFETTSKYQIVILRLVFGKVGVDKVSRSRQQVNIRY